MPILIVSFVLETSVDSSEHGSPVYSASVSHTPTKRLSRVHQYFIYPLYKLGNEGMFKRFGRHISVVKPGLHYVNPCTDTLDSVDLRITVLDLERQVIMTKDNVTISIDTSVYYHISNARYAVYRLILVVYNY